MSFRSGKGVSQLRLWWFRDSCSWLYGYGIVGRGKKASRVSSQHCGRELCHAGNQNRALPGEQGREAWLRSLSSAGGAERERGWSGGRWDGCRRRRCVVVVVVVVQFQCQSPGASCGERDLERRAGQAGKRGPWPTRLLALASRADLLICCFGGVESLRRIKIVRRVAMLPLNSTSALSCVLVYCS